MKTRTEKKNEGSKKIETSRFFVSICLPLVVIAILFGGACSSISSPMGPDATFESLDASEVVDDSTSAARYEAIGSQLLGGIFIISDMADSLDARTSR